MATAFTELCNLALSFIGAKAITDLTDGSPNALKCTAVLTYIRDEVLADRDWRFAKTRVPLTRVTMVDPVSAPTLGSTGGGSLAARTYTVVITLTNSYGETEPSPVTSLAIDVNKLATVVLPSGLDTDKATGWNLYVDKLGGTTYTKQNAVAIALAATHTEVVTGFTNTGASPPTVNSSGPAYGFTYAYALPTDFLRLVKPHKDEVRHALAYNYDNNVLNDYHHQEDKPVYPQGYPYAFETLSDGIMYLMTSYLDTDESLKINYIKRVTTEALWSPKFKICFAYRLAQALAISITESRSKSEDMEGLYMKSLQKAEEVNVGDDYQDHETGDYSWATAGRT